METIFRKYLGDDVILFTTDGGFGLKCGTLPSLFTTIDFGAGGDPKEQFATLRKVQAQGPLVRLCFFACLA